MSDTGLTPAVSRIAALLDEGSFVQIGERVLARSTDFNTAEKKMPGDGVVVGYGTIDDRLVYIYSQDASVLGGSLGEMHAKKIINIYKMAEKMGAPVIGLIDCAGLRLQEATDALEAFGDLFLCMSQASGLVPQICAVFGSCGGGMALVPAFADFVFMEKDKASLFVNSPNALEFAGKAKKDTSAAAFQSASGNADFVGTEDEVISGIRRLFTMLPSNCDEGGAAGECTDDLNRLTQDIDLYAADSAYVLSVLADDNDFFEIGADYAREITCGFIRLNGRTAGAIANRSSAAGADGESEKIDPRMTSAGLRKAAAFVKFCDAFDIPLLTLTSAEGFAASEQEEKTLASAAAALAGNFASSTVPRVNLVTGSSFGTAYLVMNSKAIGADLAFAWPEVLIGTMDPTAAAKIIYNDEINSSDDPAAKIAEAASVYSDLQASADSAAARGYVDSIIDPAQTRKHLIAAFEMLYTKSVGVPAKKHSSV